MQDVDEVVRRIHTSPHRVVIAVTGGGSRAISELLAVPGASNTVLEATVPYSHDALVGFLRAVPEQACSERTARAMAMAALQRALKLSDAPPDGLIGVGCTASLRSDREKRGEHRVHVGVQTAGATAVTTLTMDKGKRTRAEEETLAGDLIIASIAEACAIDNPPEFAMFGDEHLSREATQAQPSWRDLLLGKLDVTSAGSDEIEAPPTVVLPGAFNPLHKGHEEMAKIAEETLGGRAAFELSILNVEKPPLDYAEIAMRAEQFSAQQPLLLTRAATFVEKARLFPRVTFAVGADTIVRIGDPVFYNRNERLCREALEEIAGLGCRFLVFGRKNDGEFVSLRDLELPEQLASICVEVPEERFRNDTSSTQLRGERKDV